MMRYLIFTNKLTVFNKFKRNIFTDLISAIFSMGLFLRAIREMENKAIFMEKDFDRFAKKGCKWKP